MPTQDDAPKLSWSDWLFVIAMNIAQTIGLYKPQPDEDTHDTDDTDITR